MNRLPAKSCINSFLSLVQVDGLKNSAGKIQHEQKIDHLLEQYSIEGV